MKKLSSIAILLGILGTTSMVFAEGPQLLRANSARFIGQQVGVQSTFVPAPAPSVYDDAPPTPIGVPPAPGGGSAIVAGPAMALYPCVVVKDRHNIHPCAVPKIVSIVDPCYKPRGCCSPGPKCVLVKICVPPCGCVKVTVSKDGKRVKYDYGKYEVELKSRNGKVYVDYDD